MLSIGGSCGVCHLRIDTDGNAHLVPTRPGSVKRTPFCGLPLEDVHAQQSHVAIEDAHAQQAHVAIEDEPAGVLAIEDEPAGAAGVLAIEDGDIAI